MGKNQRLKGHNFEREVAKRLREAIPGCNAKRGLAQAREGGAECADVEAEGLPIHFECKCGKQIPIVRALEQATNDAKPGMFPTAVIKFDFKQPFVVMWFDHYLELLQDLHRYWRQ